MNARQYRRYLSKIRHLAVMDKLPWVEENFPNVPYPDSEREIGKVAREIDIVVHGTGEWTFWFDLNHLNKGSRPYNGVYMIAESYRPGVFPEIHRVGYSLMPYAVKYIGKSNNVFERLNYYRAARDFFRPPTSEVISLAVMGDSALEASFYRAATARQREQARDWTKTRNFYIRISLAQDMDDASKHEEYLIDHYIKRGVHLWNSLTYPDKLPFPPPTDVDAEEEFLQ